MKNFSKFLMAPIALIALITIPYVLVPCSSSEERLDVARESVAPGNVTLKTFDGYKNLGDITSAGHSNADNDYLYTTSVFIDENGKKDFYFNNGYISGGTITRTGASGFTLADPNSGHNGIIIKNSDYLIKNANITMKSDADGKDTCDFTGKGAAVAVFGSSKVNINDTRIETTGVATLPVYVDSLYSAEKDPKIPGPVVTMKDCTFISYGGTIYKGYRNSAGASNMVAPPWILGIMGSSRGTNIMGINSTYSFISSSVSASRWAVISVDMADNVRVNIVNTAMDLMGVDDSAIGSDFAGTRNPYTRRSGYGTYVIGKAAEFFYGVTMNVGTYATIFTDGSCTFNSIKAGRPVTIYDAFDNKIDTYTFDKDVITTVNSDTFGFMAHSGDNTLTMKGSTIINSKFSTFLVKAEDSKLKSFKADVSEDCILNNGNGVLIQVMDNDDITTGADMSAGYPIFNATHKENTFITTGFPAIENATSLGKSKVDFTFTDVALKGNIYNASGYKVNDIAPCTSAPLKVAFKGKTTIHGAIACTSAIHVIYKGSLAVAARNGLAFETPEEGLAFAKQYHNNSFSISEYYDIGHVANFICPTGFNTIDITLADNAVWTVTGTSLITSLTITGGAKVVVPENVTLTVGNKVYTNCTINA